MNYQTVTAKELGISDETFTILHNIEFRAALLAVRKSESSHLIVEAKACYIEMELAEDIQVTRLKMGA